MQMHNHAAFSKDILVAKSMKTVASVAFKQINLMLNVSKHIYNERLFTIHQLYKK